MKTKRHLSILASRVTGAIGIVSLACLAATSAVAAENSVSELLEKGIYSEQSKGDLDAAMKLYEQILSEAKGGQAVAAQAQYRLGVCYYKKKNFSQATEAFEKLVKDFPDQKDWVNRAREYLVGAAPLVAAPWTDGEELRFDLKFPTGYKIGAAFYRVRSGELDGKKTWRISSRIFAGVQSFSRVDVDAESFKPLRSHWKHTLIGDVEATYQDGKAELKPVGKNSTKQVDLDGVIYDNEQAILLMRRLPLETNYQTTVRFLSTLAGAVVPVKLDVTAIEKVAVPAGTFDCYKVDLSIRQTFWYSTDPHRYLVKFEANGVIVELAGIDRRKPGEPVTFQDATFNFSMSAPADWAFAQIDKPEKGISGALILDPQANALCSVKVTNLDKLKAAERKSPRDWAEQLLADHSNDKEFKVRSDSWKDRSVAGRPGVSFIADFVEGSDKKVCYAICAFEETRAVYLDMITSPDTLDSLKNQFEGMVDSYKSGK